MTKTLRRLLSLLNIFKRRELLRELPSESPEPTSHTPSSPTHQSAQSADDEVAQEHARRLEAQKNAMSFEPYRGRWALITGASRGIGAGYATALARRGVNLILVSRSQSSLNTLAQELESAYSIHTITRSVDLSGSGLDELIAQLTELPPISILINNVGGTPPQHLSSEMVKITHQVSSEVLSDYFQLNVTPMIKLIEAVIPQMSEAGLGYILNIASMNGLTACVGSAAYCAAKAYVISYSACLKRELSATPIKIDCVCPGVVATDAHFRSGRPSLDMPDPVDFAESTFAFAQTPYVKIPWLEHWRRRHRYGQIGHFDL